MAQDHSHNLLPSPGLLSVTPSCSWKALVEALVSSYCYAESYSEYSHTISCLSLCFHLLGGPERRAIP
jgi:hypothetical protein